MTDASGICVRNAVPAGKIVVRVLAAGHADAGAVTEVLPGRSVDIRIVAAPGTSSTDQKTRSDGGK